MLDYNLRVETELVRAGIERIGKVGLNKRSNVGVGFMLM